MTHPGLISYPTTHHHRRTYLWHVSTSQLASASDIIPREPTQPLGNNGMVGTSSRPSSSNASGIVSPKRKPNKRPRVDLGMGEGAEKDGLGNVEMKHRPLLDVRLRSARMCHRSRRRKRMVTKVQKEIRTFHFHFALRTSLRCVVFFMDSH